MDLDLVPAVPRLPGLAVPGVLGGLLRRRLSGAAGRFLRIGSGRRPGHVPELGLPDPAADLQRIPLRSRRRPGGGLMCRHLAYVGRPRPAGELLTDPPYALVRQAWAPRRQTQGIMNVDGFGLGWYVPGDPQPARHRGVGPVWGDETFADLARTVRTTALLAAVRSATAGMAHGRAAAAPFRAGRWLFSHNGALAGWPGSGVDLVKDLGAGRLLQLEAPTDAAVLWALTLDRLEGG